MIDDRDLPHCRGDACPTCGAHDGEAHGLRCGESGGDDTTVVTAVVALDFDGCINTAETYANADRDALIYTATESHSERLIDRDLVARVQRICDATGAGVVVVSAWRYFFDDAALSRLLAARGLTAPVLGSVGGKGSNDSRAEALLEWLGVHPEVSRWCVIDDDTRAYADRVNGAIRYRDPRFVGRCVHPRDGITDADADAAVAILRGALAPATCGPVSVDADGREVPT